jgi:hypothetical protein
MSLGTDASHNCIQCQDDGSPISRGVSFNQSAPDRSPVSHLTVADVGGSLSNQRKLLLDQFRFFELDMTRHGAATNQILRFLDILELRETVEIDDTLRAGEPQFHQWDETLSARQ